MNDDLIKKKQQTRNDPLDVITGVMNFFGWCAIIHSCGRVLLVM